MSELIKMLYIGTIALTGLFLLAYLPRIIAWFGALRPQKRLMATAKRKIAVIIPARNESTIIDQIFSSLEKQNYPKEFFDVYVVVKDKKDPTILEAKKRGYFAFVDEKQTRKAEALDYSFKRIFALNKGYDYLYIVDADCLLADDCLEMLNESMESKADIISSKKLVKNHLMKEKGAVTLAVTCNGLIWTLIDDMGNRFKSDHHITNMTIGTGIAIKYSVAESWGGFIYKSTLTEDMELMYDSVVRGYSTFYYSYSRIYVEEATSFKVTNIRRSRWMDGLINSKHLYQDRLGALQKFPKNLWNLYYTAACSFCYFYFAVMSVLFFGSVALGFILLSLADPLYVAAFFLSLSVFAIVYILLLAMTGVALSLDGWQIKSLGRKIATFFFHPLFYMGYFPISAKVFLRGGRKKKWIAIQRVETDKSK